MKIIGITTGHDASYCVLEDGIPIVHEEFERFSRIKEGDTDVIQFVKERYGEYDSVKYVTHWPCNREGWEKIFTDEKLSSYKEMKEQMKERGGQYIQYGHHQSHAANAFFSSNYDTALIITLDAGGWDHTQYDENAIGIGDIIPTSVTIWRGKGNKIYPIKIIPMSELSIGLTWHDILPSVFGLSNSAPIGNQAGTIMAMSALGKTDKFYNMIGFSSSSPTNYAALKYAADENEKNLFEIARALQKKTEQKIHDLIEYYLDDEDENLCVVGGVALNCVTMGKILDWFPEIKGVYVPPVPYDAGLAIGSAQYMYHHVFDKPRIPWDDNCTPYLGVTYTEQEVLMTLEEYKEKIKYVVTTDDDVLELLDGQNIISVFGNGSESGRRALGNRSIVADPRSPNMKDLINEKVKHRQWFRPFAPSILREDVSEWFVHDIDSPYMNFAIKFKEDMVDKAPAVVHFDNTGRLQTVTEKDNKWYYDFIKAWKVKSGVPILLNTSFNDREPIVETPEHAVKCFLKTNIDYLYFFNYGILVRKR